MEKDRKTLTNINNCYDFEKTSLIHVIFRKDITHANIEHPASESDGVIG